MPQKILCVDDEPNVLAGLQRQLRKQFVVETALSGEAGLDVLSREGPFAVIVSDMRMPGMNGARFLALARKRAPDSVRILLTGQTDMTAAIAAVNEGHIFRFLTKPCPTEVLLPALEAAVTQYRLVTVERTLLEQTLRGCVKVLTDVLAIVNPVAFGRSSRLKRYVQHIVTKLDLTDAWQYEVAAMLSQLGCVTLPVHVLEKAYVGQGLSPEEQRLFATHPAVGHDLLHAIPRLETIAAMIARQREPDIPHDLPQDPQQREAVLLGAHLLRVVLEFDQYVTRGMPPDEAAAKLRTQPDTYGIIGALQDIGGEADKMTVRQVALRELCPGMILGDDVRTTTGALVIAKGHEVTHTLIHRLLSYAQKVEVIEPFRVLLR